MAQQGVTSFYEIGAGKVLSGLVKRIADSATGTAIGNAGRYRSVQSGPRLTTAAWRADDALRLVRGQSAQPLELGVLFRQSEDKSRAVIGPGHLIAGCMRWPRLLKCGNRSAFWGWTTKAGAVAIDLRLDHKHPNDQYEQSNCGACTVRSAEPGNQARG